MENIITSKLFNSILFLTILGEFLLPWILSRHYDGYNSKMMAMSALGSRKVLFVLFIIHG